MPTVPPSHPITPLASVLSELSLSPTSIGPPDLLHAMSHKHNTGELSEGLNDVEVAQGADFKEGHAVLLCVGSGLLRWDLPLEGQVQPVSNQDPGNTRCMLRRGSELSRGTTTCHPHLAICRAPSVCTLQCSESRKLWMEPGKLWSPAVYWVRKDYSSSTPRHAPS